MSVHHYRINDIDFEMSVDAELYSHASGNNRFVIGKSQEMVDLLVTRLEGREIRNIVDLGIYKGGSCVLYNELFHPSKLVAIDYQDTEIPALAEYIRERDLGARLRPYYRTDQADRAALERIYRTEFGEGTLLDLVVDDASHLYEQTLASFNYLFPRLRPGSLYVIEDWAWSHWPGDQWQKPVGHWADRIPLSVLIFEIIMSCASSLQGSASSVFIVGNAVYVERGHAPLAHDFDVSRSYLSQGRPWGPERTGRKRSGLRRLWDRIGAVNPGDRVHHPPVASNTPGPLTGLWWNASESGWGITFTQRRNIVFALLYTYDSAGNPKWYAASCAMPSFGAASGVCSGSLYEVNGPAFFGASFDPSLANVWTVGSLQVDFQDANHASMTCMVAGQTRTVPITRRPLGTGTKPPTIDYTDLWWNSQESGWGMAITQQFSNMSLAWYVYDSSGKPLWYVASDCKVSGSSCSGPLYRTTGPPFGPTFDPAQVQVFDAGTVSVSFSDANNGTLSYTVDGASGTKAITRQLF